MYTPISVHGSTTTTVMANRLENAALKVDGCWTASMPRDRACMLKIYGWTMPLDSSFGRPRRPAHRTTAAPGNAVNPPTIPPIMPTKTDAAQLPLVVTRGFAGATMEYAA